MQSLLYLPVLPLMAGNFLKWIVEIKLLVLLSEVGGGKVLQLLPEWCCTGER